MSLLRVKLHNPWQLLHPKKQGWKSYHTLKHLVYQDPLIAQLTHPLGDFGGDTAVQTLTC